MAAVPKAKLGSIVMKARHERKTHKTGVGINPTSSDDMNAETTIRPGPGGNEPNPDPNPTSMLTSPHMRWVATQLTQMCRMHEEAHVRVGINPTPHDHTNGNMQKSNDGNT